MLLRGVPSRGTKTCVASGHFQSVKISGLRGSRMICLMLTRTETGADEPTDQAKNTRPQ